jgi:asparagine synthase (glutamine-hydrolysing)
VQFEDKAQKLINVLASKDVEQFYVRLVSHWDDPANLVVGETGEAVTRMREELRRTAFSSIEHQMMFMDAMTYLGDDVLAKVDRAAMGVSLETRAPLLDHRVVEAAWRIPLPAKIRDGAGKWVLRRILDRYVPRELVERPKMGFTLPLQQWLRGPMKEWAAALLDEARLNREGIFHAKPIRQKWLEHLSGKRNWQDCLWDVLMFQAWLEAQRS